MSGDNENDFFGSLQDFFGFGVIATAATQCPAETGAMEPFELLFQLRDVHPLSFHGIAPCFSGLVALGDGFV